MDKWTRRDVVKTGLAASFAAALPQDLAGRPLPGRQATEAVRPDQTDAAPRERLLFDRGWRFQLGHADNSQRDFGFGQGEEFGKTGEFMVAPSKPDFDDSAWRAVNLPHDWVVELPFENAPGLVSQGFKPVGREYPATSIGWYRCVFDLPASDDGRRLSLEFDGVFRDSIVALNGVFVGRNLSGYAPFRYDISDLARYGGRNVLVVRVDATEHEGWF